LYRSRFWRRKASLVNWLDNSSIKVIRFNV
jgi:hypothetical protein